MVFMNEEYELSKKYSKIIMGISTIDYISGKTFDEKKCIEQHHNQLLFFLLIPHDQLNN